MNNNVILKLVVCLLACVILLKIVGLVFMGILKRNNSVTMRFIRSVVRVLVIAISIYTCLSLFEETRDVGRTLFQSSALILAVLTFAAQQTFGNIISGINIALSKPFDVGQKVRVLNSGGAPLAEGIIHNITIRQTEILQHDGQTSIIPNSIMDSSVIVNTNYVENVGYFMEVQISYESDIDRAREVLRDILESEELLVKDNPIVITVSNLSSSGIVLKSTIWTKNLDDNFKACSNIREQIVKQFKSNGIVIPYDTFTVHMVK